MPAPAGSGDAAGMDTTTTPDVLGIAVGMIPVTDLARSAAFYERLLGLVYLREFSNADGTVTGCALYDAAARWGISFRLRRTTAGDPDLVGEHPLALRVRDLAALDRVEARARELGCFVGRGRHLDGDWVRVVDPDGIETVLAVPPDPGVATFVGVRTEERQPVSCYGEPLLTVRV
jgi:catechol 2,3-dioxygenase-like lactoylglutathione lyase family enzyme